MHKEIVHAKEEERVKVQHLEECRKDIQIKAPSKTLPSIDFHARMYRDKAHHLQSDVHNKKLAALSAEQERPLFSVDNTVVAYELDKPPPEYVMKTLALGPKNAVLDKFDPKDILA